MSSSNTYYKELQDENTMETAQLMQTTTTTSTAGESNGILNDEHHENGTVANGDSCLKPELTEMSTSTTSLKCCTGLFNQKRKFKIVKETQTAVNGTTATANGTSNYLNTLKEKFHSNGKANGTCNGHKTKCPKIKVEKVKKPKVVEDRDPCGIQTSITVSISIKGKSYMNQTSCSLSFSLNFKTCSQNPTTVHSASVQYGRSPTRSVSVPANSALIFQI
jgi:hypothetical protein